MPDQGTPANTQIDVFAAPLPFSNRQVHSAMPEGLTVAEIVERVTPQRIKDAGYSAVVLIDDQVIQKRNWKRVRPKRGRRVNVRVLPQGGGGLLGSILSIATFIAAPYLAPVVASGLGLSGFWVGSLFFPGTLIARGIIGIAGMLITNMLSGPPKSGARAMTPADSPTQFIEGASNQILPYGVVPVNLGTNRMMPLQAAKPYIETQNGQNFSRQLFTWGWGQQVILDQLKIGDTALSEFVDYDLDHRLNGDLYLGTSLYSNIVHEDDYSVLLKHTDGFTTRTTALNCNEALVDVTFLNGLTKFDSAGGRANDTVQLECQFALHGVSPQTWSSAAVSFTTYSGATVTVDPVALTTQITSISGTNYYVGYRKDLVVVDAFTGTIDIVNGLASAKTAGAADAPNLPSGQIRVATLTVLTKQPSDAPGGAAVTSITAFTDDRQSALWGASGYNGVYVGTSSDFAPSASGSTGIAVAGGTIKADPLNITAAQTEALRRSLRLVFPATGTYDIRIRRVSDDTDDQKILDKVTLTAIKSVTYKNPVNLQGVNGTALRIKGTDQLNGSVNTFNAIVSTVIPDYDEATGTWIARVTSNPASIYRYVLQGPANSKPLQDSEVNLTDLQDWHTYCVEQGYEYNRIIDFDASVDDVLRDVASAGAASPATVDGLRTIAIDRVKSEIVQVITPRNSWGYNGELIFPDLPHAFRAQFRNKDENYIDDEALVYDDGYDANNATIFETLDLPFCTSWDLAFMHGRRHLAQARLRPENHVVMMDIENLVALRGNRVLLAHDVPVIAVGDARIKTVIYDSNSPQHITGFTTDDVITIPDGAVYYVRCRLSDGSWLYKPLTTAIGSTQTFTFATPFVRIYSADSPTEELFQPGDLLYVVQTDNEKDMIITRIEREDDFVARITMQDYEADAILAAQNTTIPAFVSGVTTPLEFIRPVPPVLIGAQSDENVMIKNSDGTFTQRAVFTLENLNDGELTVNVQIRKTGSVNYSPANVLFASPTQVILTGMDDQSHYDINIRYQRVGGNVQSLPLQINNYFFIGASSDPSDPTGFVMSISDNTEIFEFDPCPDIDYDHSEIRYSALFSGAAWDTMTPFKTNLKVNTVIAPFVAGTYMLKHYDILGNESVNAAQIVTMTANNIQNVVAVLQQDSTFTGTKDNVILNADGSITLEEVDNPLGYYYFASGLDLGAVYTSILSASITAGGTYYNDVFDIVDLFTTTDVFGSSANDMFAMTDTFTVDDIFGIGTNAWDVELQMRKTNDPTVSPIDWGAGWVTFVYGAAQFRDIEYRLKMESLVTGITPRVTGLSATVDMPDRIERGLALVCDSVSGASVTYSAPFKNNPSVQITLTDGATDDKIVFGTKTSSGFTFTVYNQTLAANVTRHYDYISSGYGRST